jgi:methionine sulfoxide reductase heme-binding subunit
MAGTATGTANGPRVTGGSRLNKVVRDWKFRHIGALIIAAVLVGLFGWLRPEWSPMHRWNRAFGDASLVLVSIVMAIGPLSRMWRRSVVATPWRRELGVWAFVTGLIHAGFILFGWVELEWQRLFGLALHPNLGAYVMLDKGFGLSNVIGFLALIYGLVLALTSNDLSQRWLGMSVWKFMQQGAYILWILILAHTAYFLYIHFLDFHKQTPDPNLIQWPFAILVLLVFGLQQAASWRTWRLAGLRVGKKGQGV